jgi:hypothetical protein
VDYTLCGPIIEEDALNLQQELMALLGRGRFLLRNFCADHRSILEAVPVDCREVELPIGLDRNEGIKILGLQRDPLSDQFPFIKGTCIQVCENLKFVLLVKVLLLLLLLLYLTVWV